jgi:hypothetical protein
MSRISLFQKKTNCVAEVLFRGTMPPRAEDFSTLKRYDIETRAESTRSNTLWSLALSHKDWGEGRLLALKDAPVFPRAHIDFSLNLSPSEKETLAYCQSRVCFSMEARKSNVLHDRKQMLRFLRAIMGTEGQGVYDFQSQRFWTREELDDELCHSADLDVESIYVMHAVASAESQASDEPNRVGWLHTHGLGELGAFDFDILNPSCDLLSQRGQDFLRAIAFGVVEGRFAIGTTNPFAHPGIQLRLEPADAFMRKAKRQFTKIREMDSDSHLKNRAVACEPAGFMSKLFSSTLEPARFFVQEIPDGYVVHFSTEATELMAERARNTFSVFRTSMNELREFEFPCIVKIGYKIDGGGPTDKEHLWFQVHSCNDSTVDATLLNQPFNIARMKVDDRGEHPVEALTDWMIMTPGGSITPRSLRLLRFTRENKEELLEAMKSAKG